MSKGGVIFAGAAVVLLNLAVPPFQSPDEPHHFAAVMIMARGEGEREEVEAGTIALMDRYEWWKYIGLGRPVELPERIADIPFMMDRWGGEDFMMRLDGFTLFHRLAGVAMRPFGGRDIFFSLAELRDAGAAPVSLPLPLSRGLYPPLFNPGLISSWVIEPRQK